MPQSPSPPGDARVRTVRRSVDGILLLDKPLGLSSNQALQRVKHLYRARKAGHTGSLDPLATGMLPICLGEATKVSGWLLDSDKTYRFRVRFGLRTSTGDLEGEPTGEGPGAVSEAALRAAAAGLVGPLRQVPPMHSALWHNGQRLYALARRGETVEREPRLIQIRALEVTEYDPETPLLTAQCSKGTYIRTLAEDLAVRLGTVGHLVELRRLSVAPFGTDLMRTLEDLAAAGSLEAIDDWLIPLDRAVTHLPALYLADSDAVRLAQGQAICAGEEGPHGVVRLYGPGERFLGLGDRGRDGRVLARRLMAERPH